MFLKEEASFWCLSLLLMLLLLLKKARASLMYLKEEEASSFLCLSLLLLLLLLLEEEMKLEWLRDEVVGERRIIPIIFIWHRWIWDPIKKASEPPRLTAAAAIIIELPLCFSFSLWSGFSLEKNWTKRQRHSVTNLEDWRKGFGEAGASLSLSLSLSLKERRRKLWEWTVKIMLGWRGRLDFHRKGNVDTCRARLIRWRFEEEETANLQLIQSSPDLLLNFKLHPFSNLNHVLVYKSHLTCALLWVTCFFFFKKNYICRFFLCIFLYKFFFKCKVKISCIYKFR